MAYDQHPSVDAPSSAEDLSPFEGDADRRDRVKELTKKLLFSMLVGIRRGGSNMTRALVWLAMAHDERGWSVSALADATGLDRKSVRLALKRFREEGSVVLEPSGWRFSEAGMARRAHVFDHFWRELPPTMRVVLEDAALRTRGGKVSHREPHDLDQAC